jgi:Fe-S-cluster containining protein
MGTSRIPRGNNPVDAGGVGTLRKEKLTWSCIPNCGACCQSWSTEVTGKYREFLQTCLPKQEKVLNEMIANDACKHYCSKSSTCNIYEARPSFCDVTRMTKLFGLDMGVNIEACRRLIDNVHGKDSDVRHRFEKEIRK